MLSRPEWRRARSLAHGERAVARRKDVRMTRTDAILAPGAAGATKHGVDSEPPPTVRDVGLDANEAIPHEVAPLPMLAEFGQRIRKLRVERRMTLKQLEEGCGLSATHLSEIE